MSYKNKVWKCFGDFPWPMHVQLYLFGNAVCQFQLDVDLEEL